MVTVLVDAENVRRSEWPNISAERLVELCAEWAEEAGMHALVVFDGEAPGKIVGERAVDGRCTVVGTGDETADAAIARAASTYELDGEPYWLVTSDRELRERAGATAERTIGGGTFARELRGLD